MANSGERVTNVAFTENKLTISLEDGRSISAPLSWFQNLLCATPGQRDNWDLVADGFGIYWSDIGELLHVKALLRGEPPCLGKDRRFSKTVRYLPDQQQRSTSEKCQKAYRRRCFPETWSYPCIQVRSEVQRAAKLVLRSIVTSLEKLWRRVKDRKRPLLVVAGIMMYLLFVASPMKLNRSHADSAAILVNAKIAQLEESDCSQANFRKHLPPRHREWDPKKPVRATSGADNSLANQMFFSNIQQRDTKNEAEANKAPSKNEVSCQALLQGLSIQLGKANNEIQSRLNQEAEWFKIKYLYVGIILLGFLINTYFKAGSMSSDDVHKSFLDASSSFVTSFILSVTVIVAVSIDMQIRAGRIVINQLGSWINHYAEPIFLGKEGLGWESFLRLEGAYHANAVYTMTFWPNIYFLSIGLYALYLVVTQRTLEKGNSHRDTVLLGFWMLHITLLVAALSSHVVPYTFEVSPHPLFALFKPKFYTHPELMILIDCVSSAGLWGIAFAYIKPTEKKHPVKN
jgi:hypothetical protein